jgi:predicted DNA-binding transcriptional regulator AlpA
MRCKGTTASGEPCRKSAHKGSDRCHAHSGKGVGRPEKLTEEIARRICDTMRSGVTKEVAAASTGIARSTFYRWIAKGAKPDAEPIYRKFVRDLRQAEAEVEVHAAATVRRAMPDNWSAALGFLERRYPTRWSRYRAAPAPDPESAPKAQPDIDLTDPESRRMLSEILRRGTDTR